MNTPAQTEALPDDTESAKTWKFDPMHLTQEDVDLLNSFNKDDPDEPYFSPYLRLVVPGLPKPKVKLIWKVSNDIPYPANKPKPSTVEDCWNAIPKEFHEEVRVYIAAKLGLIPEDEAIAKMEEIRERLIEESYSL
jgi:hypothetical protein